MRNNYITNSTAKMFSQEAHAVSPSLLRHLKWIRIFGTYPLEISEESLSRLSKVHVARTVLILLAMVVSSYIENVLFEDTGSLELSIGLTRSTVNICATLVLIALSFYNKVIFEKAIRKLMALQRVLGNSTYRMFTSLKILVLYWTCCLLLRGVYKAAIAHKTNNWPLSIASTILWNVDIVNAMCYCILFLYLVNCLSSCFTRLCKTTFVENADVKRFIKIYTHLDDVAGDLNVCFDTAILFILSSCCVDVIYFTGVVYRGQELGLMKAMIVGYVTLFVKLSAAVMVIHTCQNVSDQAERCNSALLSYLINYTSTSQFHEPSLLTHVSMKNGLTFKLLKSVPINYNLGTSMIAAYITYSIVLFQFYSASPGNKKPS